MLAEGAKLTDMSKTLGHSSVAITGKVYAHGYEEGKRAAVAGVGRKFRRNTDSGEGDAPRKGGDGV
jgi:hypothetical protein